MPITPNAVCGSKRSPKGVVTCTLATGHTGWHLGYSRSGPVLSHRMYTWTFESYGRWTDLYGQILDMPLGNERVDALTRLGAASQQADAAHHVTTLRSETPGWFEAALTAYAQLTASAQLATAILEEDS